MFNLLYLNENQKKNRKKKQKQKPKILFRTFIRLLGPCASESLYLAFTLY